jgi:hypothetical protein
MEKEVLSQSNNREELESLVLEAYPGYDIIHRNIIQIKYYEKYKYHQVFKLKPKKNPH